MALRDWLLAPVAFAKTLVDFIFPGSPFISRRDHFAPHPSSGFEGYYSRTQLDDGSTLVVIFCWVKDAKARANLVFVSYTPSSTSRFPGFQYDLYPEDVDVKMSEERQNQVLPFSVDAPGVGTFNVAPERVEYAINVPHLQLFLSLRITELTPWSPGDPLSGPMGPLLHLSHLLPLNWHVRAPTSAARVTLVHGGAALEARGAAHLEKNWGAAFPRGWLWGQAFGAGGATLSFAGGAALPGVGAGAGLYLLGYRSRAHAWDMRPPLAAALGACAPFLRVARDSRAGAVRLDARTLTRRLVVQCAAPPASFAPFPAPLAEGHRRGFAFESFRGTARVELWTRRWPWQAWTCVEENVCGVTSTGEACAALEFGGSFWHNVEARKDD